MKPIETGIERLEAQPPTSLSGKRIGLLANPASVNGRFEHSRMTIDKVFPGQIKALFSPQHGFFAEKQDNMIESENSVDPVLQVPVFSLYGKTREPTSDMLEEIDVLIVDLQDVGTRVYTFIYTMALCMKKAKACNKEIVVLDRPNPIDGVTIEGNCLRQEYASFVGMYPIPMRHGMTMGEIALLFNDHFGIGCQLSVVPMSGWDRRMRYRDTGLPWIAPSPNLPTPSSALVYPGQVLWEGTNVSEGRGTTQPFEVFGAPFLNLIAIMDHLNPEDIAGIHLRPLAFEPTYNKWTEHHCFGFQIHVVDPPLYRPYRTSLAILEAVYACHNDTFQWKAPPYEYEYEKLPIDCITGDPSIRKAIEKQEKQIRWEESWEADLRQFEEVRKDYFLYR